MALKAPTVRAKVRRNFRVPLSLREAAPGPKPRPIAPAPRPARAAHLQRATRPGPRAGPVRPPGGGRRLVRTPACGIFERLTEPVLFPPVAHSGVFPPDSLETLGDA